MNLDHVLDRYRIENPAQRAHEANTNAAGEALLRLADAQLGDWCKVALNGADVASIMLPWHDSEGGDMQLVPPSGSSVAEAVEWLNRSGGQYETQSPVCWRKLARMREARFTSLFLSTTAIDQEFYERLERRDGLVSLDGLHRAVSWELHQRLSANTVAVAYVAGCS